MKVFYTTDFKGHWPVGTSAIIVAKDVEAAEILLRKELEKEGLGKDEKIIFAELPLTSEGAFILNNGEY